MISRLANRFSDEYNKFLENVLKEELYKLGYDEIWDLSKIEQFIDKENICIDYAHNRFGYDYIIYHNKNIVYKFSLENDIKCENDEYIGTIKFDRSEIKE